MVMENSELGMVQAKEAGKMPQTAGLKGKPLQASDWEHEGEGQDNTRSKVQTC